MRLHSFPTRRSSDLGLAAAVQNPIYSTAVGLLLYARENAAPVARGALLGSGMGGALNRMKSWFQGHF